MSRSRDARFCIDDAFDEEPESGEGGAPLSGERSRPADYGCAYKCPEEDSDSLIQEYGERSEPDGSYAYCWNHPKVRENWKTVCVAVGLLVAGAALLALGLYTLAFGNRAVQGAVFLLIGSICFIPGAYHVVYIYLAARGFRGYDFYHLPLFT